WGSTTPTTARGRAPDPQRVRFSARPGVVTSFDRPALVAVGARAGTVIVVDTAIRALSAAINDPTTAVHGLDVLEVLVRQLSDHDLDDSLARDEQGQVRLVWRSPNWDDLLDLAFEEIREYGAGSIQICRRMRALLEAPRASPPAVRNAGIHANLTRLAAQL